MDRARYAVDAVVIEERSLRSMGSSLGMSKLWVAIHRALVRRGFVTPQPQKRPRTSWKRFEASLPNETWQADMTHRSIDDKTAEGIKVGILDFVDDYSRMVVAGVVVPVAISADVVAACYKGASTGESRPRC